MIGYGMGLFGLIPFVFGTVLAQSTSSLTIDAGGVSVKQAGHPSATAGALTISGRHATSTAAVTASALLLQASDKSTAAQATIGAELARSKRSPWRIELSGSATTFGALTDDNGSSRAGFVRPQYVREHCGLFGTLGSGVTLRDTTHFHSLSWDAGAWMQRGRFTGSFALRRSFTNDFPLVEASNIFLFRAARHYSLQDVEGSATARISRIEVQAIGAWRTGFDATKGQGGSLLGAATIHVHSNIAFVVSGGKQLAELMSGVPAATVLGASVRVSLPGRHSQTASRPAMSETGASTSETSPFATRVERHAGGGATVTVRVNAPSDARVELSGTFNDWIAVAVPRSANVFELTIELLSGTHRIAIRVNGGEWKAPTGLARIKDDLGGEAGLIVVP